MFQYCFSLSIGSSDNLGVEIRVDTTGTIIISISIRINMVYLGISSSSRRNSRTRAQLPTKNTQDSEKPKKQFGRFFQKLQTFQYFQKPYNNKQANIDD